jgi:hypothetical protein
MTYIKQNAPDEPEYVPGIQAMHAKDPAYTMYDIDAQHQFSGLAA